MSFRYLSSHAHTHTCTSLTRAHTHIRTHTFPHIHTHTHTRTHTHTHTSAHTHSLTYTHAHTHTLLYLTHAHTHSHTYEHILTIRRRSFPLSRRKRGNRWTTAYVISALPQTSVRPTMSPPSLFLFLFTVRSSETLSHSLLSLSSLSSSLSSSLHLPIFLSHPLLSHDRQGQTLASPLLLQKDPPSLPPLPCSLRPHTFSLLHSPLPPPLQGASTDAPRPPCSS